MEDRLYSAGNIAGSALRHGLSTRDTALTAESGRIWDAPLRGVYARNIVYKDVRGWESFEPWLTRTEQISIDLIWYIASTIPPAWYANDQCELEWLLEKLDRRRTRVGS
jgi:hypothetical protein